MKYPKPLAALLLGLIIVGASIGFLTAHSQSSFLVKVQGDIHFEGDLNNTYKPEKITISSYEYEDSNEYIPNGDEIAEIPIKWENETYGTYSGSLKLPFEMRTVVFPYFQQDEYEEIYFERDKTIYNLNFRYDGNRSPLKFDYRKNYIEGSAERQIQEVGSNLRHFSYGEYGHDFSETDRVRHYVEEAGNKYDRADIALENGNKPQAYLYALQATWYLEAARNFVDLAEMEHSLEKSNVTLKKFYIPLYTPPDAPYKTLRNCQERYDRYKSIVGMHTPEGKNLEQIKEEISELEKDDPDDFVVECQDALRKLEDSYNYQQKYAAEKLGFLTVALLSALLFGALSPYRITKTWISNKKESISKELRPQMNIDDIDDLELIKGTAVILAIPNGLLQITGLSNGLKSVIFWSLLFSLISFIIVSIGVWRDDKSLKVGGLALGILGVSLAILGPSLLGLVKVILPELFGEIINLITTPNPSLSG